MKVSIIIPAYNEEKRIKQTLTEYYSFFKKEKSLKFEIMVVINNTKDKTEKIVRNFAKKRKEILWINLKEGGKGNAVIQGFKRAMSGESDLIGFVDADLATPPEAFLSLIKSIGRNGGVIASRYISGANVLPKPTIQRIIASRVYNILVRTAFLLPYRDTQCGAKLFRKEALKKSIPFIGMTKWAFDIDLIYNIRKQGFSISEIPTKWSDKAYSTINFAKAGPWMALAIIRLRILNSPLKDFIRLYDEVIKYLIWNQKK